MSQKITSKNLSYNSSLPPFLAALHAQTSNTTGPDPLLAKHRRAVKKRSASEEAEDVPLVVDEDGNTIAVEVGKDGTVKEKEPDSSSNDKEAEAEKDDEAAAKKEEGKSGFGARKRKMGRVVGDDDEGDEGAKPETSAARKAPDAPSDKQTSSESKDKKVKKKAKKIKLSFDDGD